MENQSLKEMVIRCAKENYADIVGVAPAGRFEKDSPIFALMPGVKSVIGLAFRVLRGVYRGIEEGSTYYQYTTMGVENMEETILPMGILKVSVLLEEQGYIALPQRRHQQIMAEENSTNPEVAYDAVYRGRTPEQQMDFLDAAVKCGLGEKSFCRTLLTDDFGPMVRYAFILTDAVLEPDEEIVPHLCDRCEACREACPGHAIKADGSVDPWQCAVYYNGANGTKNPFMPKDAFAGMENRMEIIAGEADVTPETAKKILDQIYFYPPAQHAYQCSICGRSCDVACYIHLEEKGLLTKTFRSRFRKRPEWEFSAEDFQSENCSRTK